MADVPVVDAPSTQQTAPVSATKDEGVSNKEVASFFKSQVETAKRNRRTVSSSWKTNVDLRLGKPSGYYTDTTEGSNDLGGDGQTVINPDWALTKTKTANLYSQVPTVQVTHENKQYAEAVPLFAKALNYELGDKRVNIGVAMEEVLNDVVNAAGVGGVIVGYAARFETKLMPDKEIAQGITDPKLLQEMVAAGMIQLIPTQQLTDSRFYGTRISPSDLLWPAEFTGSNFDDGPWVGYNGRSSWGACKAEFKLKDADKDKVIGAAGTSTDEDLRSNSETRAMGDLKDVRFTRVFYWRYRVDPEEPSFCSIWQIVWVDGMTDPVIHEAWKGQEYDERTHLYIGARKFPLRVLTLTYITDNPVPPSDSAAGRPQVNDMRRSRTQMFQNRERSRPLRWHDVNRIDPQIAATIERGTWQNSIPVNGDGTRAMGEVARASYPAEDITFDQQTKADLMETWQVGPNQLGTTSRGDTTKGEAELVQANFSTRIGQERGRVESFFLGIVDVLAGLMALYSDYPSLTQNERDTMLKAWDPKAVAHEIVLKVRPDSTVVLSSQQRYQRLERFMNTTVKSGFVNPLPILTEMAELAGLDPSEVIKQPQPPKPDEPTMSYRFSGKEDLQNPIVMALLVKNGQAPSQEELEEAKKLLAANLAPPAPQFPHGDPRGAPGATGEPGMLPPDHNEYPDWNLGSRVMKRSRDAGIGG